MKRHTSYFTIARLFATLLLLSSKFGLADDEHDHAHQSSHTHGEVSSPVSPGTLTIEKSTANAPELRWRLVSGREQSARLEIEGYSPDPVTSPVGVGHGPGEVRVRWLVDGTDIAADLPAGLPLDSMDAGPHDIAVMLDPRDRSVHAGEGEPIETRFTVLVPKRIKPGGEIPRFKRFDLSVDDLRRGHTGNTIRVTKGEWVGIAWRSSRHIDLHLHGYDVEI
ncbi:MAG: hypothetical protein DWQ08_01085, partial [Proteobacteria bacterium]